ncbi:hypothetical protein CVT24_013053 [Panaeolus cyanescens]|uniref:Histidinol-phosphatase n=1 Tax=Panaeolus cyanescens TaxID=181874 RepID=A0A409YUQ2_9AGAR|nr:hypothetical protein CVT24_013053 [Panaeolus cyanescens]
MPHSHHSHSGQFCKHATGTLEQVVEEAIRQGFEVYGLTEHVPRYRQVDLYPEEEHLTIDDLAHQFDAFLAEAHRLKVKYATQIQLLVGLESESITELDLEGLDGILKRSAGHIDYVVGSIHHVRGTPIDFDFATYQKALSSFQCDNESEIQEAFLQAYFDAQYDLIQRFKPEVIGHFDLCRLYCPQLRFSDFPEVWKKIERNVRCAVDYGALFEINAAAFRKKWDTAYPGADIVSVIQEYGGRFALSDDSHGPHAVGLNYHRLPQYLRSVGISELWYLKASATPNVAGRNIQAVQLDGDCLTHKFWRGKMDEVTMS